VEERALMGFTIDVHSIAGRLPLVSLNWPRVVLAEG
jgi:hypothetical protein